MGTLLHHTRRLDTSWAVLKTDNGDICHISVAQTGVKIKKSRFGLFGKVLFNESPRVSNRVGFILSELFPESDSRFPRELYEPHFVLSTYGNALLHLVSAQEVATVLGGIMCNVENSPSD